MRKLIVFLSLITSYCNVIFSQQIDSTKVSHWEQKAKGLYETFKYDSAGYYYLQAAEIYKQQKEWVKSAYNYRSTANSLILAIKPDSALYFAQKANNIANNYFIENTKNETFEKADILLTFGDIHKRQGKYVDAIQYYVDAINFTLQADSLAKVKVAKIWNKIGHTYCYVNQYDKALEFCEKSYKVIYESSGNKHIDLAATMFNLGIISFVRGNYYKALEYYQKSLKIRIQTFGKDHPDVAKTYNNIGDIYRFIGQYDKAIENSLKSLHINIQIFGENHLKVGDNYLTIGAIHLRRGNYEKAHTNYQKSLNIKIHIFGENDPELATTYISLGLANFYRGDNDKALVYYLKALKVSTNNNNVLMCYNNIAVVYRNKEDYNKAFEYNQKALRLGILIYGDNHPQIADSYTNIGIICNYRKDYNKALEYYNKALKIRIKTNGEQHHTVAKLYNNIGSIYSSKGDYKKALEYFQKTLEIRKHIYGDHHPFLADSYNKMTIISDAEKDFKQTLDYYQKALIANLVDFNDSNIYNNPDHFSALSIPELYRTSRGKAKAFFQLYNKSESKSMDNLNASLLTYDLTINLIHKIRTDYSHENSQLLLSENKKYMYEEAIQVALELYERDATKENMEKAFEFIEKSKSATLGAHLNSLELNKYSNIAPSLIEKEKNIVSNRRKFETKIQQAKAQKNGYDTLLVKNYQDKSFNYSMQYDSLMNTLKNEYPNYFNLKYKQDVVQIKDVEKNINKNSALINYFVGDTTLFISVITNKNNVIKTIKTDSLFNEKIMNYYIDIKSDFAEKELKNSTYFYNYLIEPIAEYLEGKNNLVIVPDGNLYYIPFETLCKSGVYAEDLTELNYLIKDYSISYHHTATLWLNSKEKEQKQIAIENNFMGFAPVFDPKINNGLIVSNDWISDTTGMELATRSVSHDFTYFNPLAFSESEVKSIVKLFTKQKKKAKGFFHKEANEENFKQNIETYKYIHIASHSFTNDLYPNLSGIAFSQPDTNYTDKRIMEDGILYAGETYNLNLSNADLIVLSSCKSGLGKLIQGEGFLSLSRGFLYAGTPNILFSIWNVKDEQTKDLMIYFYKQVLKGTDYANALREAKIQLINNPKTALPKYWAAWMLVGR